MIVSFFTKILGYLMDFCYGLVPNYLAAIALFTLITKIILFPLSLWCQKNSLKMVALMPELNRIKARFYGDRDAVGEEQNRLYKRENYHPLLSVVPLVIQIVILMGLVGVIHNITDTGLAPRLGVVPWTDGGVSWLMPVAAAAASAVLGLTQNVINPLQKEQSKAEQWMTNLISIAISLFLGAFVAVGVASYWIFSSLFSIPVQWLCNICMPPKKYVDYEALEASRRALGAMDKTKTKLSPEDRRRERADYKRFFHVVNKHIVFYAEGAGFYKYFESVISWLLAHSTVTIHYITNDPRDGVFALAEQNPRFRAYFIGENRFITLMLKLDTDIMVMTTPDLEKMFIKRSYVRKDIEYVYIDHGISSCNMLLREGALDYFDTVFCSGQHIVDEMRAQEKTYGLAERTLVPYGYGLLANMEKQLEATEQPTDGRLRVCIGPSWYVDNILDSCLEELLASLKEINALVTIRPHPQYVRRFPARMEALRALCAAEEDWTLEESTATVTSLLTADVLISDWSNVALEYAFVTKRPVLFVNTPMKVVNPNWEKIGVEPVDFRLRRELGRAIAPEEAAQAGAIIRDMVAERDSWRERITASREKTLFTTEQSGPRGGKYLLDRILARQKEKKNA